MSETKVLYLLYLSLKEEMIEIEKILARQTEVIFAQTRAILISKSRLDALIAEYHKILGVASSNLDQDKEYERRLEEATDVVISKQKYKM